jgi:serine/threonine protein kinase
LASKAGDIWSLGCTIIEMLTGSTPWPEFRQMEAHAIMYKIASQDCKPKIPESLSPAGKRFLARCFCRDPKKRATVDELLQHEFITQPYDGNFTEDQEYVITFDFITNT